MDGLLPLHKDILELQSLYRRASERQRNGSNEDYDAWKKTKEFEEVTKRIEGPLIQERNRQIEAMTQAMENFLAQLAKSARKSTKGSARR